MQQDIPRKLFKSIVKQVKSELDELGVKLVFRRSLFYHGFFDSAVDGTYKCSKKGKKTITIKLHMLPKRSSILFILFHELRHAQHHAYGIFPSYYQLAYCPDPWLGLLTEQDCNDYASDRLEMLGISSTIGKIYPMSQVRAINKPRLPEDITNKLRRQC